MNVETLNKILLENVINNDSNLSESDYNVFQKYKNFMLCFNHTALRERKNFGTTL